MPSSPDAARDLLFGLFALQNGLIDQSQLVAAFHAWTRDKARPLADHLLALGHIDADGRGAVDAMAALHLKKHGGDVERSLAAVPAGASTRKSLAEIDDPDLDATLGHVGSGSTDRLAKSSSSPRIRASSPRSGCLAGWLRLVGMKRCPQPAASCRV